MCTYLLGNALLGSHVGRVHGWCMVALAGFARASRPTERAMSVPTGRRPAPLSMHSSLAKRKGLHGRRLRSGLGF